MGRIVYRDSQGRDGSLDLTGTETVFVGRGLECAIRTDDAMVSRRHSQIRFDQGRFFIEDLGSANGTLVNNARVQRHAMVHNDVVQCGSLWLRFLEEGPAVAVAPQGVAATGKKGGTMVLSPDGGEAPARPQPISVAPPISALPVNSAAPPMVAAPAANLPYGGPPAMPAGGGARGFGGAAAAAGAPSTNPNLPYGGPPSMPRAPDGGAAGYGAAPVASPSPAGFPQPNAPAPAAPSIFGRGAAAAPVGGTAPTAAPVKAKPDSVMVDLGLEQDADKLVAEVKQLKGELDRALANYEREVADGKRVRAESTALRDRIREQSETVKDREEQIAAHGRAADELRGEIGELRGDLHRLRAEHDAVGETIAARDRQLQRAQEDITRLRDDLEDKNRQLMELSRTKDEGWKRLNDQLSEIENLREVINEQERMLEERRVGLISQEEAIKELRADKDRSLKVVAQLRAERDEVASMQSRLAAQLQTLEEENKRLGRLMVEAQTDAARGTGGSGGGDMVLRLTNELKEARVELRRFESDRERQHGQSESSERDRTRLESRLAQVEVELQETQHARLAAESARNVAQDALAKAEVARHKAAEEALLAARGREQATSGGDDARRELDRHRRRITELEAKLAAATAAPAEAGPDVPALERKLRDASERAHEAERAQRALQAELEAARTDADKAKAEAGRARAAADAQGAAAGGAAGEVLVERAREVYDQINAILSDMRTHVVVVRDELGPSAGTSPVAREAVDALVDAAESAKGALRGLRELTEP